jgi:hypothetical protein
MKKIIITLSGYVWNILDGSICTLQFHKNSNKWTFKILESETVPYSNEWVNILKSAVSFSKAELKARIKNTLNISLPLYLVYRKT